MPLRDKQSRQGQMGFDWPAILKTFLVEIAVLVALAGAFVFYVNWSSQVAFEEFMNADQSAAAEAEHRPPASIPVQAVKGRANCDRKG
jgi:flagellar basal body-associated protein FliL